MDSPTQIDLPASSVRQFFRQPQVRPMAMVLAALMAAQCICYFALGTGETGHGISTILLVFQSLIALWCTYIAFRKAHGITSLFWFLFGATLLILLVPTAIYGYDTLFHQSAMSNSTESLLYCLFGAPIMMMLFLPELHSRAPIKWEVVLDLVQVTIVVTLVYSTFFFLPVHSMTAAEAYSRNLIISNALTLFLLAASLMRMRFARSAGTRRLLMRLALFLISCVSVTVAGNWIDQHHYAAAFAWFDLGWDLPQVVAALIAISWQADAEPVTSSEAANFLTFLRTNLVLVAMLSGMHLLMDRWKQANGEILTDIAVAVSLLAFTLRLALTQFHQQQEISQRRLAQSKLSIANDKIRGFFNDARRQTCEITQVNELGNLLQACTSRNEAFRLIPERMRRLFPGSSGCIALVTPSRNRVESVAEWGPCPPSDHLFTPDECWALRRGCAHAHSGGASPLCCSHLLGDGPSLCIPLVANGETLGTFALQDSVSISGSAGYHSAGTGSAWVRQLAVAVAENIAIATANLSLRDALRAQAVHDPLTGLYNRRYMEEFLDRELRRAVRRGRPLAILMLDLDHFKRYNDNFGHAAGDRVLAAVGETLLRSVRAEDVACRYGGEEFAIILVECALEKAVLRANDIRERLRECRVEHRDKNRSTTNLPTGQSTAITVSIGVAAFDETTDRVDLLMKFADDALYQAKRHGRNRVVAAKSTSNAALKSDPGPRPISDSCWNSSSDHEPAALGDPIKI